MKHMLFLLPVILFIWGCDKKVYTKSDCEQLSQASFRGSPKHAHEFQKHCQDIEIKYTHELCQDALNDLIISGDYAKVLEKYGAEAQGCFSENDLKKFSTK